MPTSLFQALEETPLARFVLESSWAFPTVETLHVLSLTLVVGSISMVDLRLLGWASRERPISGLSHDVLPLTWGSFGLAATTGLILFISKASEYIANWSFQIKILLLLAAGLNMVAFQFLTYRSIANWDGEAKPALAARIAGALSLAFWIGVVACGRWIGFTL